MSDNVIKFRKIEKKPEPKAKVPRRPLDLPGWVPFAALIALALVIYAAQHAGFFA